MQQEKSLQKQKDLSTLETFVVHGCTEEDPSSNLLKQLCCRYPYHFIQLMKRHGRLDVAPDTGLLSKCYIVAVHLIEEHYWKLQRYLARPPQGIKEQRDFYLAVEVFEDMILRQNKDN
jgi:hypothetical protein